MIGIGADVETGEEKMAWTLGDEKDGEGEGVVFLWCSRLVIFPFFYP